MNMRIVLLRLLIGWWAIPLLWMVLWPIACLISEKKQEAIEFVKAVCDLYWNGTGSN